MKHLKTNVISVQNLKPISTKINLRSNFPKARTVAATEDDQIYIKPGKPLPKMLEPLSNESLSKLVSSIQDRIQEESLVMPLHAGNAKGSVINGLNLKTQLAHLEKHRRAPSQQLFQTDKES